MKQHDQLSQLHSRRTHWLASLFSFYLRRKIFRHKIPLLASFKLTYRCNLACRACPFHHRAVEAGGHLSWSMALECLQLLEQYGCRILVFEGGEPFLWKDGNWGLADLVREAQKRFLRVAITTNGTFPLAIPADLLWVSLDGLKETHDRLRSNSFDAVWANLTSASHSNILIHMTLNKENWNELESLVRMIVSLSTVRGITLQLFYPYGQGEEPLLLSLAERTAALEKAIELKKAGYPIFNSQRQLHAMIENKWKCHDDILINVDPNGQITQGCYAKSRGKVQCRHCGFTPGAEASGALDLYPGSIITGWRTFIQKGASQ